MSYWRQITLGEICDAGGGEIRTGPFGSQLHESDYSNTGTPVVMPKDIANGRVDEEAIARVSSSHVERLAHHKLGVGDIVYGRRGDIGRKALVTQRENGWLCGTGCLRINPGVGIVDSRFLFYRLGEPSTVAAIANRAIGATMPNLNTTILREVALTIPPLSEQRRIASILGAYDDLIEVNRRRIALLEGMARSLFEEWFIHFRFPGHEEIIVIDTSDGLLPEGWQTGIARELIDFDPRTQVPRDGEKPHISMSHLGTTTSLIAPFDWRSGNSGAKFRNKDTLFARITPCLENGKTGIVRDLPGEGVGFGSTEFIVMRGNVAGPAFVYCLSRFEGFRSHAERGMSGASGRQRTRAETVAAYKLAIPPADGGLLNEFEEFAWPALELAGALGRANRTLSASRDLLLPRLVCGDLSVAAAERELEDAA